MFDFIFQTRETQSSRQQGCEGRFLEGIHVVFYEMLPAELKLVVGME
ncbi:hypothetical protein NIES2098_11770 [Calothrix sp. NIES-2098]|nr:hypothetical protein NIES2098_11770 [Calothrix sp. NIES-2098]